MSNYLNAIRRFPRASQQLLLNTFICTIALYVVNPFIVASLHSIARLSVDQTASAIGHGTVIGSLVALLFATSNTRVSKARIGMIACVGLSLSAFALSSLSAVPPQYCVFVATAIFFCHRFSLNTMTATGKDIQLNLLCGEGQKIVFWGVSVVFSIGCAIGPFIGTFLVSHWGLNANLYFASTLFALAAANYASIENEVSNVKIAQANKEKGRARFEVSASLICVATCVSYGIYAQIFSFVQLMIAADFEGQRYVVTRAFFVVYAATRIGSSFWLFPRLASYLRSNVILFEIGTALCCMALVGLTLVKSTYLFLVFGAIFAVGEAMFGAVSMPLLGEYVRGRNNQSIHVAFYTFCSTAVGLGAGQSVGVKLFETGSLTLQMTAWIGAIVVLVMFCSLAAISLRRSFRVAL